MSRALRIVLIASLALNLALAAALGQWIWKSHHHPRPAHMHDGPAMFRPDALRAALSAEHGAMVDQILASHRDAMHGRIKQLRQARENVRAALLAEPFQRGQLDAAFAKLRASEADTAAEAHAILTEVAQLADATERDRIAGLVKGRHAKDPGNAPRKREPRH